MAYEAKGSHWLDVLPLIPESRVLNDIRHDGILLLRVDLLQAF